MKLLGLIGGVSPESTPVYYRHLNEAARARLGGEHSANILLYTVDYGVVIEHYNAGDWPAFIAEVVKGARHLAAGGAEAIVITSNTTHVAADACGEATGLPVIHMLDVLAREMKAKGMKKPLLFGTPVVMSGDHYLPALKSRYDGDVMTPDEEEQAEIGRVILDELVNGDIRETSRRRLLDIVARYERQGADGLILGCTELCLILDQTHTAIPVFDTTRLHALAASAYAFGDG